jgi:hypothetical protein
MPGKIYLATAGTNSLTAALTDTVNALSERIHRRCLLIGTRREIAAATRIWEALTDIPFAARNTERTEEEAPLLMLSIADMGHSPPSPDFILAETFSWNALVILGDTRKFRFAGNGPLGRIAKILAGRSSETVALLENPNLAAEGLSKKSITNYEHLRRWWRILSLVAPEDIPRHVFESKFRISKELRVFDPSTMEFRNARTYQTKDHEEFLRILLPRTRLVSNAGRSVENASAKTWFSD